MNQSQSYMDTHSAPHMSAPQSYGSYSATSGSIPHYQPYPQPSAIPQGSAHYTSGPSPYGNYYSNGVTSPQSASHHGPGPQVPSQAIQLPAMHMPAPGNQHSYVTASAPAPPAYQSQHQIDTTGQTGPPGIKPKVTATLWEDEGSLCFQVEAKGVCVARREDNHFINGTKLLNVAGMTRGRRDGILKSEKTRHVVKIGPMHLKGVWIPFERALDFANKEKITDQLYPLFVHNIGSLLYNPESISRTNAVVAATERRRMEGSDPARQAQGSQAPSLHHHHSMQSTVGSQPAPHTIAPHPSAGRPGIDRAHTFPTPPTSASSVLGMGNQGSSYEWGAQNLAHNSSAQALSIDTGLNNTRSMPTTPATTPPGGSLQSMQPYQNQQSFEQKPYYATTASSQNGYASQQNMNRYGHDGSFKSEMGPPSAPSAAPADGDHHDSKADVYGHGGTAADPIHHDGGYVDNNPGAYGANRSHYSYNPANSHQHVSPEMTGSPSHQSNSGRGTPRTLPGAQQQWTHDFQTPPRSAPTSSVYSVMGESRSSNGGSDNNYTASTYSASSNGPVSSNKRGREDDDHERPSSRDLDYKRQKTYGTPMGTAPHMQAIATGGGLPRQR